MAKIKASKMLMVKMKYEIAVVRPGTIADMDSSEFRAKELNLNLLDAFLVPKVKGKIYKRGQK